MTPKGLLRLKQASSTLEELADGAFRPVSTTRSADHERVRRLVLCTGKVYYDIVGHEERAAAGNVAVARIEQLYPFPVEQAARLVASLPAPRARSSGPRRSRRTWAPGGRSGTGSRRRCARTSRSATSAGPWRARPSEGYPTAHLREQDRIVREALGT